MTDKKIRLFDGESYLGTFNDMSADLEAKRLGGVVKITKRRMSHNMAIVYRDASTAKLRTNNTLVKVLYGRQNLGTMTWESAKAYTAKNKSTIKLSNPDSNPATYTIANVGNLPLKKG